MQWQLKYQGRLLALLPRWGGGITGIACLLLTALFIGYCYLLARQGEAQPARGLTPLTALCSQPPVYISSNKPYAGPGVHPIAIYHQRGQELDTLTPVRYRPAEWIGTPFEEQDTGDVQLVACAKRIHEAKTAKTCSFAHGKVPLYQAIYRVRVLEVRTGHLV